MTTLPQHLEYAIRLPFPDVWHIKDLFDMDFTNADRDPDQNEQPYITSCFLEIQNDIDRAFIRKVAGGSTKIPDLVLRRFPYPKVTDDPLMNKFKTFFSLLFVLCMILSCKNIIKVSQRLNCCRCSHMKHCRTSQLNAMLN